MVGVLRTVERPVDAMGAVELAEGSRRLMMLAIPGRAEGENDISYKYTPKRPRYSHI